MPLKWISRSRHNRIRTDESSQRRIVVARVVEHHPCLIQALAGEANVGGRGAAAGGANVAIGEIELA